MWPHLKAKCGVMSQELLFTSLYNPQFVEQLDITENSLFFGKKSMRFKSGDPFDIFFFIQNGNFNNSHCGIKSWNPILPRTRICTRVALVRTYNAGLCLALLLFLLGSQTCLKTLHFIIATLHAPLPGRLAWPPCPAALPGRLARQPYPAALPGSLARQPCPAALPGSLARQPCPAALPGSLARQPCPAA
jgi:hypothetical protein